MSKRGTALLGFAALLGCSEPDPACPDIGYLPGLITVVDSAGQPVFDAVVTLRVNGGPESAAECNKRRPDGGCDGWRLGPIGSNAISVTRADGSSLVERTVVVRNTGTATCEVPVYPSVEIVLPD